MDAGLKVAIKACPEFRRRKGSPSEAGTISALAGYLGISRGAICQWKKIPPNRVIRIEAVTGIDRSILRPDLYRQQPARAIA